MRIAFVVARVGEERNVIQRLSLVLAEELKKQGDNVDVFPFSRSKVFNLFSYRTLKNYDCVLISNLGLQCAYFSVFKRLGLLKKLFVVISFGSDIRLIRNRLVNFFNRLSKPAIDLLIVINPDLVSVAKSRGYKNVEYVHSWACALS